MSFPGYIEIECPFCEQYRHIREDQLHMVKDRTPKGSNATCVVCDDCWKIVQVFIEMERDKRAIESCERARIRAQTNVTFKDG